MTQDQLEIQEQLLAITPSFTTDITRALAQLVLSVFSWIAFFSVIWPFLMTLLGFLGYIAAGVVIMILLLYTFTVGGLILDAIAYKLAERKTNLPYMNYPKKCPFFYRRWLTFYCKAEQIQGFSLSVFEKCHNEEMWLKCWPDRVPSILNAFDMVDSKKQQQFIYLLASMKEHASAAIPKMMEVLTNDQGILPLRLSAGYALSEMKEGRAIEPLIGLLNIDAPPKQEQTIRAILSRFGVMALPQLSEALQNSESDIKAGGFAEIIGKIGDPSGIPVLKETLLSAQSQEYTRLQTIYSLQAIGTKEVFEFFIEYLENAPEDEKSTIKEVILSHKLITFPILIQLLSKEEISDEYYAEIGDILVQVQASTYDRLFTKLQEDTEESQEYVQDLAKTLKEHTPEEEEYIDLHTILDKYV